MEPTTPPPPDPMGSFDPSGPSKSGGGAKVMVILVVAVVLALIIGLGAVLLSSSGDDGGDDADEDTTEEADASDEPAEETVAEDEDGEGDALDSDDDADIDEDGIPDVDDTDDDGDGVPDPEDPDPVDPDVPDEGGGDGGEPGEPDEPGDGGEVDPPAEGVDLLLTDPQPAIDGWLDAAGANAKAVEVVLYTDYGIATIRDAEQPNKVYRSLWRDGAVDDDPPEDPFPGTDLEAESFRLDRPNWDALPGLVANAPERAGLPQGEVTHVIVTSDLPFSDRKIFRIYVDAPNGSDYVLANLDGVPVDR